MEKMRSRGMSRRELLALPAVVSLDTASRCLGMGRTKGHELARANRYPVRVLRLGRAYKVSSADLLDYLGIPVPERRGDGGAA